MRRDRLRLQQRARRLRAGADPAALLRALAQAQDRYQRRLAGRPAVAFDDTLPIAARRAEIEATVREHQVVVVCGETGSGKSTQLPKICLALGRGKRGFIGHTQPRRIAARSIAVRLAAELHSAPGHAVGHKMRFSDNVSEDTCIKVVTDGMLLSEVEHDRRLDQYDTLIIDEAHERSLNIDFLLGYLRQLLPRRPDLKLIITSATIDPLGFSRHFDGAPVIEVSGRTYPVEVRYRPLAETDSDRRERQVEVGILKAVDELSAAGPGDILVFLPGERDIRNTAELLRKRRLANTEILPLYARLSSLEQQRIFQPHGGRRIILATNVAETSLTVPGIRYVVDSGLARISRYRPGRQVQALPIEAVSQASADQRKGRCGRTADGICIRLYAETDYAQRPRFTEPEVLRTSLAGVILRMAHLRLGDPAEFPFLDPPTERLINDGYRLLEELAAVDDRRRLTGVGRKLARLPVDPRIGRMLLAAGEQGALAEVLTIAAALSIQDPREYPAQVREQARALHQRYLEPGSDFLSLLKLWSDYHRETKGLNQRRQRNYCRDNLLSYVRMREWMDVRNQLAQLVRELHLTVNARPASAAAIHRSLLAGLLGNIACAHERHEYLGTRGKKLFIHPRSSLFKASPKWFMAAELVDTERLYAHMVAAIQPQWAEQLAPQLVRRQYLEPHWEKRRGEVVAFEQVTLFGLTLVSRRQAHYGAVAPAAARAIFIRAALVAGELGVDAGFLRHNRGLVAQLEELEHKSRRRDVLVSEEQQFTFYDTRVPADVFTARAFHSWRRAAERDQPRCLFMNHEDLMQHDAAAISAERFPDHLEVGANRLALVYHFEPGHINDGVTVRVPLPLLRQLPNQVFTWLVPGLRLEKIIALIKSLPKPQRRHFVPAPDVAERALALLPDADAGASMESALERALHQLAGNRPEALSWDTGKLPLHLKMNFAAIDADGAVIDSDRDLAALQRRLAHRVVPSTAPADTDHGMARKGIRSWDLGNLPQALQRVQQGVKVERYPALVDDTDSVAIRLYADPGEAETAHRTGVRRLLMLALPQHSRFLRKNLPQLQRMCLHFSTAGDCAQLRQDIVDATLDRVIGGELPRDQAAFQRCTERARSGLMTEANELCALLDGALEQYHTCRGHLDAAPAAARRDIDAQLSWLLYPGFVTHTPAQWLCHYPRYLNAVLARLQRLAHAASRDSQRMQLFEPWWQRLLTLAPEPRAELPPPLSEYRWLLEEYRVSLFAQELKTAVPVSPQRLQRAWQRAAT